MGKKHLIVKMLELVQELDKTDKNIECSMIVNDIELLIDNYVKSKLKNHGDIGSVSESAEIENGRNTCNHKWVELWSGDPDSQSMEFEGEKCRLCGSNDSPI